ncbi:MAG: transcriptional regulator, partial [Desulfobulbus sp.]|nr:transcriptional regulator [Desulfobulbus sp.]
DSITIRQQLMALLTDQTLGARELSQALHQSEKEIYTHLQHIARSLKTEGRSLKIDPAVCLSCGFVFRHRQRPEPPGHCPNCRKTRIRRPQYYID